MTIKDNMDFVEKVKLFNSIAGTSESFDARKTALYTGLILEEVSELIHAYNPTQDTGLLSFYDTLKHFSQAFKSGEYDPLAEKIDRLEALDAAVDIAVVAIGQGISVGGNITGACNEVAENNLTKFPMVNGAHTVLRDSNGKVKKPNGYKSPELAEFLK